MLYEMFKNLTILFFSFFLLFHHLAEGQNKGIHIASNQLMVDANDPVYKSIKPGDTLYFDAGSRKYLLIKNFRGEPTKPLVMINSGGEVIFDTDHYYGISIQNCRYFKLTGTGDTKKTYGFKIARVTNGAGVGIGALSSDFEIDHLSVENTLIGGIYAKTDPDSTLTSVRGTFTQYNTIIHDNYIANVGDEGLYVGSTKYLGQTVHFGGKDVLLFPSLLDGVKIYNNIIKYPGWDGIQVSSASKNCQIYNNTILYDSQAEDESQMAGIMIGGGTKCDCYNNFISQGKGDGIEVHGLGGTRVFNNIIVDPGITFAPGDKTKMKYGIFVTDVSVQNDSSFYIEYNNIINPKSEGIRFSSVKSKNNMISSNVIINPGNFDYYQNGNTSFKGIDAYIMFQYQESEATLKNNYLARNGDNIGFKSLNMETVDDFNLVANSPLVDNAIDNQKINFDFSGTKRPQGSKSDIGAIEYLSIPTAVSQKNLSYRQIKLLQNPVRDFLIFSMPKDANTNVFLSIYNLSGKMIAQLRQWEMSIENQTIQADISGIASGIYVYTIRSGEYASSGKFIKR